MMFPSLLDVASLIFLPPHREVILAELVSPSNDSKFDSSNARESFNKFIVKKSKKRNIIFFQEHSAFILYWLYRYVVFPPSNGITKEYIAL